MRGSLSSNSTYVRGEGKLGVGRNHFVFYGDRYLSCNVSLLKEVSFKMLQMLSWMLSAAF